MTTAKPTEITAKELVGNLAYWAMLKDARKLNLIWKDDHIDGIGQVLPDSYGIQYGGQIYETDIVTGDTLIKIEWLTNTPTTDAPVTPKAEAAEANFATIERALEWADGYVSSDQEQDITNDARNALDDLRAQLSVATAALGRQKAGSET